MDNFSLYFEICFIIWRYVLHMNCPSIPPDGNSLTLTDVEIWQASVFHLIFSLSSLWNNFAYIVFSFPFITFSFFFFCISLNSFSISIKGLLKASLTKCTFNNTRDWDQCLSELGELGNFAPNKVYCLWIPSLKSQQNTSL